MTGSITDVWVIESSDSEAGSEKVIAADNLIKLARIEPMKRKVDVAVTATASLYSVEKVELNLSVLTLLSPAQPTKKRKIARFPAPLEDPRNYAMIEPCDSFSCVNVESLSLYAITST